MQTESKNRHKWWIHSETTNEVDDTYEMFTHVKRKDITRERKRERECGCEMEREPRGKSPTKVYQKKGQFFTFESV